MSSVPNDPRSQAALDAADEALRGAADDIAQAKQAQDANRFDASVAQLQLEIQQANERALRAQAEVENYRRRVQREMQDERKYACQGLLTDLLPALDNIERAIESAHTNKEGHGLLEGVRMVHQLLLNTLEKHHCQRIEAANQPFDPTFHEAIAQLPSPQVPPGHVAHVSQQGYRLHERIIRPAQVVVSQEPPAAS